MVDRAVLEFGVTRGPSLVNEGRSTEPMMTGGYVRFPGVDSSVTTTYYRMLAKDSASAALRTWVVTGSPDTTGASYPGPGTIDNSTIRVADTWSVTT